MKIDASALASASVPSKRETAAGDNSDQAASKSAKGESAPQPPERPVKKQKSYAAMSVAELNKLGTADLGKLNAAQLNKLNVSQLNKLGVGQLKKLSPANQAKLNPAQKMKLGISAQKEDPVSLSKQGLEKGREISSVEAEPAKPKAEGPKEPPVN